MKVTAIIYCNKLFFTTTWNIIWVALPNFSIITDTVSYVWHAYDALVSHYARHLINFLLAFSVVIRWCLPSDEGFYVLQPTEQLNNFGYHRAPGNCDPSPGNSTNIKNSPQNFLKTYSYFVHTVQLDQVYFWMYTSESNPMLD